MRINKFHRYFERERERGRGGEKGKEKEQKNECQIEKLFHQTYCLRMTQL